MAIKQAVLIEAGGEMEFSLDLVPDYQEIGHGVDGIQVRADGNSVYVKQGDFVVQRGHWAALKYPIVVDSILQEGKPARVTFRE